MKYFHFFAFIVFILFLNISCDQATTANITVINRSAFDLFIDFDVNRSSQGAKYYKNIEILRNEIFAFRVGYYASGYNAFPLPHKDINKIFISDLNSRELIKIIEKDIELLFELVNSSGGHAEYRFEITDDLLK